MASKYQPLYQFLANLAESERPMTFTEVEQVLGSRLPRSAHQYQAWWANDKTHTQAQAWLDAGWKTAKANLIEESVVFVSARTP